MSHRGRGGQGFRNGNGSRSDVVTKRPRLNETSQEDEEADYMDIDEMEQGFREDDNMEDDSTIGQEDVTATTVTYEEWERPPVNKDFEPKRNNLIFQQIDMDNYILPKPVVGMPGANVGPVPVLRFDNFPVL